jgi:hypothetical protein
LAASTSGYRDPEGEASMDGKKKSHIIDLKARLKLALAHAKDHAECKNIISVDFGEEKIYILLSREFIAAYQQLDTLVQHDRFTTMGNLKLARDTLLRYRNMLNDDGYQAKSREIWEFIKEIDAVHVAEFGS